MKRSVTLFFSILVVLVGSVSVSVPTLAQGANNAASAECKQGGWQNLTDADGNSFKNQGGCVSYAVRGGVLLPVVVTRQPIVQFHAGLTGSNGYITGSGFVPGEQLRYLYWPTDDPIDKVFIFIDVDEVGTFEYPLNNFWCFPDYLEANPQTTFVMYDGNMIERYRTTLDLNEYCS